MKRMIAPLAMMCSMSAFAIPSLQLDIGGGTYVGKPEESTIANSDAFALYSLLQPNSESGVGESYLYRISAAVYPQLTQSTPAPDLGTFSFAGQTWNVTGDMTWGTPPDPDHLLEGTSGVGADLPPHGIFETYYMEFDVEFDPLMQCLAYDVQSKEGDPTTQAGAGMYYQSFAVDVSGLQDGYGIHFDLYQVSAVEHKSAGNGKKSKTPTMFTTDIIEFAPFSHDAGSTTTRVPDQAATLSLLGMALAGLAGLRRKFGR